jgi:hypothetical protein
VIAIDRFADPSGPLSWQRIIRTRAMLVLLNLIAMLRLVEVGGYGDAAYHAI